MVDVNKYSKIYTEIEVLINHLPKEDKEKIPKHLIDNINEYKDKEYQFIYDDNKSNIDQNYSDETKALFIYIYEQFLVPEDEKKFWKKYDQVCFNMIEEEKRKKYPKNSFYDNAIKHNSEEQNNALMVPEKIGIFKKIINFVKNHINSNV